MSRVANAACHPSTTAAVVLPEPSSATTSEKSRSDCSSKARRTASSASGHSYVLTMIASPGALVRPLSRRARRPFEQRADDAAPLSAEPSASGVALARVEHLERDRLVDRRVVLELREVEAADRGLDDRGALVQQVARDPGGRDVLARRRSARSQRSSVSIALKATAPSSSSTLIFGKSGLPSRSTLNPISTPIGRRTSTTPGGIPSCGNARIERILARSFPGADSSGQTRSVPAA